MPEGLALPRQQIRPVWIKGEGGSQLFGWFITQPEYLGLPTPGAVLMHGWGAHAGLMLPAVPWLHEAGLALLVMLPLLCGVLSSLLTRPFCAVPRTSVSRIA